MAVNVQVRALTLLWRLQEKALGRTLNFIHLNGYPCTDLFYPLGLNALPFQEAEILKVSFGFLL